MILSLGGLGAGAACPNSGWADQRHGLGIIHCPGQLQRQQLLCQHCAGGNQSRGRWARVCYRTSLRTQQRDCKWGGSRALTALGTHKEDEDALASLRNTTERTRRAQLHSELLLAQHHGGASQSLGSLLV